MGLIYLVTMMILFFSILFLKKSDKKLNIIVWVVYTFGIIYFIDCFEALVLSTLNIKNSLLSFSIFNIIISLIIYYIHKKKYGKLVKQNYYLNKKELITVCFLMILCLIFGIFRYSGFNAFNYRISDATVHFKMSNDYSNYMKLFDSGFKDEFYNFKNNMFGYYVPCGLFMNIMPFLKIISFNIFNTMFFCLLVLTFYVTIISVKKGDKHNLFALFITLLYSLAYPLNYTLFGFGYLGSGILAVNLIFLTWDFIIKYDKKYLYLILLLFNYGLFVSYYLFAPAIYLSEGLYMIYLFIKEKYNLKELLKYGIFCLIIPTVFGFFYFVYSVYGVNTAINNYSIDGFAYNNLIGNYILLLPMAIYSIVLDIKRKKIGFDLLFFICEIAYIIFTFGLVGIGGVSPYYFYKSYFILWIVTNILIFKLINIQKAKTILIINYSLIVLAILFSIVDVEKMVSKHNFNFGYSGSIHQLGDIYDFNFEMFRTDYKIDKDEVLLMKSGKDYSKECGVNEKNNRLPFLAFYLKRRVFYSMNGIAPTLSYKKNDSVDIYSNEIKYSDFLEDKKAKCLLISKDFLKENKDNYDINYDDYDILYSNKAGKLIKKK